MQWGDKIAYEDLLASGVKAQEINMDIDPVAVLFGEEELTKLSHKKPFVMKVSIHLPRANGKLTIQLPWVKRRH